MDASSTAPATLGKYEIRGTLGRGAMGTVYDGWDPVISRRVAIKTVAISAQDDPDIQEGIARFRREAQAAGRLTHPNIVGIYDYGETADTAYIVMEFVEGQSLKERLDHGERLSTDATARVLEQILAGLQFSHDHGVVHRDIKPGNVMLTTDGRVKLADFGIARIESSTMTQDGSILGTPAYMSPEQLTGQGADARSDIYAAGVVLYQLLAGERPFDGGIAAITHKALNTVPPKPSDISVAAPPALDAVVMRAMARRPAERFQRADEFAQALHAALAVAVAPLPDRDQDATAIMTAPRASLHAVAAAPAATRSRAPLFAGVAVAALLLAGGGWYAMHAGGPTDRPAAPASAAGGAPATADATRPPPGGTPAAGQTAPPAAPDGTQTRSITADAATPPRPPADTATKPEATRASPPGTIIVPLTPPEDRPAETRPPDTRPPETRPPDSAAPEPTKPAGSPQADAPAAAKPPPQTQPEQARTAPPDQPSAPATQAQTAPDQSAPTQSGPTQSGPTQSGPTQAAPTHSAPIQPPPDRQSAERQPTDGQTAAGAQDVKPQPPADAQDLAGPATTGPSIGPTSNGTGAPPPASQPPAAQPPATQPPATQPSATQPPRTQPPATQPFATQPSATQPSGTQPQGASPGRPTTMPSDQMAALDLKPPPQPQPQRTTPVVAPPLSPDAIRTALRTIRRTAGCALPTFGVSDDGRVEVGGLVGAGAPSAALHDAVGAAAAGAPIAWRTTTIDGPYCPALDVIRPIAQPTSPFFALGLKNGATQLRDREQIEPILRLPDFPAHLQVDYLSHDGSVTHLFPSGTGPDRSFAANGTLDLRNLLRANWQVGPPFGTDMIIAVASSVPLFGARRGGEGDTVGSYLPALQDAIEAAQRKGARVTGQAITVDTVPR